MLPVAIRNETDKLNSFQICKNLYYIELMMMSGGGGDGGGGVQCHQPPHGGPWTQCPLSVVSD